MTKKSSIKKNIVYQVAYEVLVLALPFVTSPYVSRILGAEKLGIYTYTYSIAYYFVLFAMLGLINYGNRAIAQVRDNQKELNKKFSSIFYLHAIITLVIIGFYGVYIFNLSGEDRFFAAIQLPFVISALFDISWFFLV